MSHTQQLQSEKGFTLFEISITLMLLGIVMVMVIPRLGPLMSGNPETVARRLQLTVRTCRERSIMMHQPYRIVLDLDNQLYFVQSVSPQATNEYVFEKDTSVLQRTVKMPRDIRIMDVMTPLTGTAKEGETYITILQDGLFPGAVVHLIDEHKNKFTLTFQPLTGRLVFEQGYLFTEQGELGKS